MAEETTDEAASARASDCSLAQARLHTRLAFLCTCFFAGSDTMRADSSTSGSISSASLCLFFALVVRLEHESDWGVVGCVSCVDEDEEVDEGTETGAEEAWESRTDAVSDGAEDDEEDADSDAWVVLGHGFR